jgi:hypothetical protein
MPAEGQSPVRLGVHTCDIDADGDIDIVYPIHEFGNGEHPDLYINQGGLQGGLAGMFLLDATFEARAGVYSKVASADVDGDGDRDLLLPMQSSFEPETNPPGPYLLMSEVFTVPDAPLVFIRGEVNGDTQRDIGDPIAVLGYLFSGMGEPPCLAAADANGDDTVDIADAIYLLAYLFSQGPDPVQPFPDLGDAASELILSCQQVTITQ